MIYDVSDHFPIISKVDYAINRRRNEEIYRRKTFLTDEEWHQFSYELDLLLNNELNSLTLNVDADELANKITSIYRHLIDKFMPLKKLTRNEKNFADKPWITTELKKCIKRKKKLYKKSKEHNNQKLTTEIKKYSNLVARMKVKAYNDYYKEKIARYGEDKAKTWRIINEITNRKRRKGSDIKCIKTASGEQKYSKKEIVNCLNTHFATVGKDMDEKFKDDNDVNQKDPLEYIPNMSDHNASHQNTMYFPKTDTAEILDAIVSLETSGFDLINNKIIKQTSFIVAPYLERLFNMCLNSGVFPDIFKIAKVTPLHKGGDKQDPNAYRPISLLPCIGKLFEKILSSRLIDFFEKYDLFSEHQFGFRKGYNTELAVIDIYEKLLHNLDNRLSTCAIFLDLAKAFDSVNHTIIIKVNCTVTQYIW